MIGLAYSVRQPEVPIDESLKRRPTVYAHMRVGALNTRIYVIYVYMPTNILLFSLRKYAYV